MFKLEQFKSTEFCVVFFESRVCHICHGGQPEEKVSNLPRKKTLFTKKSNKEKQHSKNPSTQKPSKNNYLKNIPPSKLVQKYPNINHGPSQRKKPLHHETCLYLNLPHFFTHLFRSCSLRFPGSPPWMHQQSIDSQSS